MADYLDEEMKIMQERIEEPNTITAETLKRPISDLTLPPIVPLDVTATLGDAIFIMQKHKCGSVVITEKNKIVGIFTERDVLNKVAGIIKNFKDKPIVDYMTRDPFRLRVTDSIAYLLHNMHVGDYRHVPIVNNEDGPISVISIKGINSYLLDHFPKTVINISSLPYRGPKKREGA